MSMCLSASTAAAVWGVTTTARPRQAAGAAWPVRQGARTRVEVTWRRGETRVEVT